MKALGGLIVAIIVGFLALWLALELFIGAMKLLGVLIAIAAAVVAFFVAEKFIGKGR